MSDPSFARAREVVQAAIADSSNPQFVDECLNQAQREVARAHRWPELIVRGFFNTIAAYSTGTVDVTEDDATVALTGGTFPTDVETAEYRFSLSYTSPWYTVATRTSGASIELAQPYIGDTETGKNFVVYKAHYSMPSTVDRIEEMWIHDRGATPLCNVLTDQEVYRFEHFPSGAGVPTHFLSIERDINGNRQILLGPVAPDDVYRVEYTAQRKVVDNQFAGNLDDSRWPVILARAKALAYEPEFYDRSLQEMQRYRLLLDAEWANESEVATQGTRVGQDRIDYEGMSGMDCFLGRGTIDYPQV